MALEAARNHTAILEFENRDIVEKYIDDDFIRESEDIEFLPLMMFREFIKFFKELKVHLVILMEYFKAKS